MVRRVPSFPVFLPAVAACWLALSAPAFGSSFVFATAPGALVGTHPVDIVVTLDLESSTTMLITIQNLETNPTADTQALNSITFSIAGNLGITGFSSSSTEVTINSNAAGDYSDNGTSIPTGWNTTATNGSTTAIALCDINNTGCGGQGSLWPEHTLIGGPDSNNAYSSANGSITSSKHDPFLFETETFTVTGTNIPYLTLTTAQISTMQLGFGTATGQFATATFQGTPEPHTILLITLGFGFLLFLAWKRNASASA